MSKHQPVVLSPRAGCHRQNSYNLSNSTTLVSPGKTEIANECSQAQTNNFKRYTQNTEILVSEHPQ